MPLYEYRCESCGEQFEVVQPVTVKAEETACPHCRAQKATRLMSSFASKIVGDHKPGFAEMKAYDMLNERMNKFSKLPPAMGKRVMPSPENFGPPAKSDSKGSGDRGGA
ncbi:MAG: FmdB family zinc ribbon protein [Nitrospiraceae bacterium]